MIFLSVMMLIISALAIYISVHLSKQRPGHGIDPVRAVPTDVRAEAAQSPGVRFLRRWLTPFLLVTSIFFIGLRQFHLSDVITVPDWLLSADDLPSVADAVVFVITWWTVLFLVLPWGNRPREEPETGHAASAPERPRIGTKMLITTLITMIIWVIIFVVIRGEFFSFREAAFGN